MTESLTYHGEVQVNGNGVKFDWKLSVFLVMLNLIAVAVQWGALSTKLEELSHRQEQQDRHMEFIDNELKANDTEAGEVREFRRVMEKRFDKLEQKLDARR